MENTVITEQIENKKTIKRYHLLDSLRGFLLILMIIYHTMYDITVLGSGDFSVRNMAGYIFQQFIGWGFIFLSGMCRTMGKRHLRRGLIILASAALVSLVTFIFMPGSAIFFGVLVFLGSATLIMIPLEKVIKDVYPPFGFLLCLMLFMLCKNISSGNLGFESLVFIQLPDFLYQNLATAYLGFPPADFASGDYYPLFPWFFLYLCGYFFWKYFGRKPWIQNSLSIKVPVLDFLGRHSLWVYLIHQPVCFGMVYLFCVVL